MLFRFPIKTKAQHDHHICAGHAVLDKGNVFYLANLLLPIRFRVPDVSKLKISVYL